MHGCCSKVHTWQDLFPPPSTTPCVRVCARVNTYTRTAAGASLAAGRGTRVDLVVRILSIGSHDWVHEGDDARARGGTHDDECKWEARNQTLWQSAWVMMNAVAREHS
jgi:hypothetical protein